MCKKPNTPKTAADKTSLDQDPIGSVEKALTYEFTKKSLLLEALTHSSAAQEKNKKNKRLSLQWNERLEFLGDSVLSLVLSSYLMSRKEAYAEGSLSKIRAGLVSEASLAAMARELGIGRFLVLSKGEVKDAGFNKDSVLADALEALFGAIMQDGGYQVAEKIILKLYTKRLKEPFDLLFKEDHKSILQEKLQKEFKLRPEYTVIESKGPEHSLTFGVAVSFQGKTLGRGYGSNKKRASQQAAADALSNLDLAQISTLKKEEARV